MSDEVIREGSWHCPNCQAKNRGRDVKCPSCGQAREGVVFEYDEAAQAVTEESIAALARGGADWICAYCSTSNRAANASCSQCAAARSDGKARAVGDLLFGRPTEGNRAPGGSPSIPHGVKIAARVLALVFLLFLFLASRERDSILKVEAADWQRTIEVQRQIPVTETDWLLPAGARELSSRSEIHHHRQVRIGMHSVRKTSTERVAVGSRQVKTGTKDMGNGFFKDTYRTEPIYENRPREHWVQEPLYRSEPVYQTRYTYEIQRWKTTRTERASEKDTQPFWPAIRLAAGEREGPRKESLQVLLKDETSGKSYPFQPDLPTFQSLRVGENRAAIFDGLGRFQRLK